MGRKGTSKATTIIYKMRRLAGMTVREAAEVSGLSPGTIMNWEHSRSEHAQNIQALLQAYFSRIKKESNRVLMDAAEELEDE